MTLRTADLEFELPDRLIARRPAEPRDSSRLLVCSRSDPGILGHARFGDLPGLLAPQDLLVFNVSSVVPARLVGHRTDTGGKVEGLYLSSDEDVWTVALRSNGQLRPGQTIEFVGESGECAGVELLEKLGAEWLVRADGNPTETLGRVGRTPLPPYILRSRRDAEETVGDAQDRAWYQTVYSRAERAGSVAAPTAGLHFTPELIDEIRTRGARTAEVVLHVGAGTFRPVEADTVEDHDMHAERAIAPAETLQRVSETRGSGGRVVAVGTTSVRVLETVGAGKGRVDGGEMETRLLITPGWEFRLVDGLITNFHLPRSTLLALVGAMFQGGVERVKEIYAEAIASGYRFYSYGDAMLILP